MDFERGKQKRRRRGRGNPGKRVRGNEGTENENENENKNENEIENEIENENEIGWSRSFVLEEYGLPAVQPNFVELADRYPSFRPYLRARSAFSAGIEWNDGDAVRALTTALVDHFFKLKIELPPGHLCPTVFSRWNYVRWIRDLIGRESSPVAPKHLETLASSNASATALNSHTECLRGIDIGTGASCIYPLIGRALFGWCMVATDTDAGATQFAQRNVDINGFNDHVQVRNCARDSNPLTFLSESEEKKSETFEFAFSMCNPPFFDADDAPSDSFVSRRERSRPGVGPLSRSASHVAWHEAFCAGGEVGFIREYIRDSVRVARRVEWFTCLLGHKSSLVPVTNIATSAGARQVRSAVFQQGRTWRWGIAWSFSPKSNFVMNAPAPHSNAKKSQETDQKQ